MNPVIVGARVAVIPLLINVDGLPTKIGHVLFWDNSC